MTEIRLVDGKLDEVVGKDAHLEQMDYNRWWLRIGNVCVWLHAKGRIAASQPATRNRRNNETPTRPDL
jgi:hypothetical protein